MHLEGDADCIGKGATAITMGAPGGVKLDKLGRPLNFGNYKNGRLVTPGGGKGKGKGGSRAGGSRGGGGGAAKGKGGGGRGLGGGGRGRGGGSGSSAGGRVGPSSRGGGARSTDGRSGGRGGAKSGGAKGGASAPARTSKASAAAPKKRVDDGALAVGMGSASEAMVRAALESASLEDDFADEEFEEGQEVEACYIGAYDDNGAWVDFDGLWYPAVVDTVSDEGILVYFEETEECLQLDFQFVRSVGSVAAAPAAAGGKAQGKHDRGAPRAAGVPPPPAGAPLRAQREALPAFAQRAELLSAIERCQCVVVEGETGCGKTTQVPQYVLEAAAEAKRPCRILCTQPRRISAVGVAERVAAERGEAVGGTVGYSIRLESKSSAATALLFCTSGILIRRLEEDGALDGVTHVFVDEVHERSMESDFLLMVLRDLLRRRADLRLVLMSATLNAGLFARYFASAASEVPTVRVPGRTHAVTPLFLEDVLDLTQHKVRAGADWARKGQKGGRPGGFAADGRGGGGGGGGGGDAKPGDWRCQSCGANVFASKQTCFKCGAAKPAGGGGGGGAPPPPAARNGGGGGGGGGGEVPLALRPDALLSPEELAQRYPRCSAAAHAALGALDFEAINYELIVQLVGWLRTCPGPHAVEAWLAARGTPPAAPPNGAAAKARGRPASAPPPAAPPPPPPPVAEERRYDTDGELYSRAEFVEEYGGTAEWDAARRPPPPPPSKKGKKAAATSAAPAAASGAAGEDVGADAILVFLPGFKEIQTLHELLLATKECGAEPQRSWVLPLHSTLPPEEQRRVFDRPPAGVRKLVLTTNIAETAITVDDVAYVIDSARMKQKSFDPARRMESLDDVLVSRANAKQRRGRAGRCRPGVAFHLLTSHAHESVAAAEQPPEVQRVPLERLVLTIKALGYPGSAAEVCAALLEPPEPSAVRRAVRELVDLDALELVPAAGAGRHAPPSEQLSALGAHLAALPVDVRIGKLILFGAIFGLVDETLTIAAALSHRSPFLAPFDKRELADAAKRSFSSGGSDHLTVLRAYSEWDAIAGNARYEFAREHFLSIKSLQTIGQLKRQLLELLSDAGFVPPGLRSRHVEAAGRRGGGADGVKLALQQAAAGLNGAKPGDWRCESCGASVFAFKHACFKCGAAKPEGGGAGDAPELRYDTDGELYSRAEFVEEYGGTAEWDAARRQPPPAAAAPAAALLDAASAGAASAAGGAAGGGLVLKALLCAALYPQVIVAEPPAPKGGKGGGKGGGGGGGGGVKFTMREDGATEGTPVQIHPSSVNARATRFESRYLVFAELVKTTQVYVRDCSPVSAYALMLFGGALKAQDAEGAAATPRGGKRAASAAGDDCRLIVDGWIKFKVSRSEQSLMEGLRSELDQLLRRKIASPNLELNRHGQGILKAVTELLGKPLSDGQ